MQNVLKISKCQFMCMHLSGVCRFEASELKTATSRYVTLRPVPCIYWKTSAWIWCVPLHKRF